jgi:hypothetical protein
MDAATFGSDVETKFAYDRYGNRLTHEKFIGATQLTQTNLTHPAIDENTNRFEANQGYAFDKNGNLVTDPTDSGRSSVFNADNKQKEVRGPSTGRGTAEEREKTYQDLADYCHLDTLAMVEIYNHLQTL